MRILILGGGAFFGRAITDAATSAGHEVTTFTRSTVTPGAAEGCVEAVFGDRTEPGAFDFASTRFLLQLCIELFGLSGRPSAFRHRRRLSDR
jgi:uncharacterized protein YbjT (DUF2867 family)